MSEVHGFIQQHFALCFGLSFLWVCAWFSYFLYRHRRHGIRFPALDTVRPLFHEDASSGCSHRSFWTRLGGARRCLRVTVTDREVWVRLSFPFTALSHIYDLEHRIPREAIASVAPSGSGLFRSVLLDYRQASGVVRRLQFYLRDPAGFLAALESPPQLPLSARAA